MENQSKGNAKNILSVLSDVLLVVIIIIAIMITVMTFTTKSSVNGIGNILGYTPFSVQTDSMSPYIEEGDVIICKEIQVDEMSQLKVGDVITYKKVVRDETDGNLIRIYNTHRIYEIVRDSQGRVSEIVTKGDNAGLTDDETVKPADVIAKQVNSGCDGFEMVTDADGSVSEKPVNPSSGMKIRFLGSALDFLQNRTGFMICIIIPLALFFIWQIYKLITMFMEAKSEDIDEETKRRAVEEYLAEQAKLKEKEIENNN